MRTTQLGLRTALAAFIAFVFFSAPVGAQSEITITFDDLIFAPPGSVVLIAEEQVDADLVGRTCFLAVGAENQASVHIGNDLIVATGSDEAVIVGVEDTPNGGTSQTYRMKVGPTITVHLRLGPDGVSSLGFGLLFDCEEPTEVTTPDLGEQQVETTTSTSAPPTTVAPTTAAPTTAAPTTAAPTTAAPTTAAPTTAAPSSSTSAVPATVAGAVTNAPLPETPPARAVTGAPAYTG